MWKKRVGANGFPYRWEPKGSVPVTNISRADHNIYFDHDIVSWLVLHVFPQVCYQRRAIIELVQMVLKTLERMQRWLWKYVVKDRPRFYGDMNSSHINELVLRTDFTTDENLQKGSVPITNISRADDDIFFNQHCTFSLKFITNEEQSVSSYNGAKIVGKSAKMIMKICC